MPKIKLILKIFAFILIIKTSFLVGFAFVGEDQGLDIYKKIDEGMTELNNKMYSHELKGAKSDGSITENINKNLENAGLGDCLIEGEISEDDVQKIAFGNDKIENSGNLGLLGKKLPEECNSIEKINKIQGIIQAISKKSTETANSKSNDIYNISNINIYIDGDEENSPFDLIVDIKEIDKIIFGDEYDYEGEENIGDNEIDDYLDGDLVDYIDEIPKSEEEVINDMEEQNDNNQTENIINNEKDDEFANINNDSTQSVCPVSLKESGLSQESLDEILDGINGRKKHNFEGLGGNQFGYNINGNANIGTLSGSNITSKHLIYKEIDDNNFFECSDFFCITIEFITKKLNLFIGGQSANIKLILKVATGNLKKTANTSLTQGKMTTNNFELGLRDLSLPDNFSMPVTITKKPVPLLDIDHSSEEKKKKRKENEPLSSKNILEAHLKSVGISNPKRENDLSSFNLTDAEMKNISNSAELSTRHLAKLQEKVNKNKKETKGLSNYINRVITTGHQSDSTEGLYKEFIEFESFTYQLLDFVNNLAGITKKINKIPIHQ